MTTPILIERKGPLCAGCASLRGYARRFDSPPLEPYLRHSDCTGGVHWSMHFGQVWPLNHYERIQREAAQGVLI